MSIGNNENFGDGGQRCNSDDDGQRQKLGRGNTPTSPVQITWSDGHGGSAQPAGLDDSK